MSSNLITDLVQVNLIKQNIKNAIINKGQVVTNFNSYSGAIENIQAGKGDIPLYENIADMQNNSANVNELALVYSTNNLQGLFQYSSDDVWNIAPTGLTASNEYVNSAKFMGANGVETGVLQVNSNLTAEQVKIKAQVFSDLSYLELDPNITSLANAFRGYSNLKSIPNINTSNITNMNDMFFSCPSLIDIPEFDTSKVTDMTEMFCWCRNLINISNFNTSNVKFMSSMFAFCYNLTNIPNFDTSNVKYMTTTFQHCYSLTTVPNFNTSNVEFMSSMFEYCTKLVNIPNFDTNNVTGMSQMFDNCTKLVNIPNFDTNKVTDMSSMFSGCHNLITIPNFNTNKVRYMSHMFSSCHNLVNIPDFSMINVTNTTDMFYQCNNLSDASIANIVNMLPNASQLTNQYISSIGLNLARFDDDQLRILNNKGYIDAVPKPVGLTYNITYTI